MFHDINQTPDTRWGMLSAEDKKKQLFLNQKQTLDLFLERNAISQAQYNKSLHDLIEKMGMQSVYESIKR